MALMDLNRAQDTPIATLKLSTIVPKDWHRYPPRVAAMTPVYVPAVAYTQGDFGDDVDEASANTTTPYTPTNQEAKAIATGNTMAKDISRPRGYIEPRTPYPTVGFVPPAGPVITTITPSTAPASTGKLVALVVGTGFTPWTIMRSQGRSVQFKAEYISPTLMQLLVDTNLAPPGTYGIQAVDHDIESVASNFILT